MNSARKSRAEASIVVIAAALWLGLGPYLGGRREAAMGPCGCGGDFEQEQFQSGIPGSANFKGAYGGWPSHEILETCKGHGEMN